jgi:hypothetical protein
LYFSSGSNINFITPPSTTECAAVATTKTSNTYEKVFETINNYTEVDKEYCEDNYSIEYNYENNQRTTIDFDEPSVFCYDSENSSIDERDGDLSDHEHNDDNRKEDLDEAKLKMR